MKKDPGDVRFLNDLESAVREMGGQRLKCLFLDQNLLNKEGPAVIRFLRKEVPGLKIVILARRSLSGPRQTRLRGYSDDLVFKETLTAELIAHVIRSIETGYQYEKTLSSLRSKIKNTASMRKGAEPQDPSRSLGTLAAGIAHDFNNMLTGILGNISLAKILVQTSDPVFHRLNDAEKGSLRATELSNELLAFAQGENPVKKRLSLSELLGESVRSALRGSNVKSQFFLKKDIWPVEADERQIGQVIHHVTKNAQQAMPEGGAIQIFGENFEFESDSAEGIGLKKGPYVKISFKDFGPGIRKKDLPKIFEPYFTTKEKGRGLGLSIALSNLKNHDGTIRAESSPGSGTTVHIFLPASVNRQKIARMPDDNLLRKGQGKVLVIDDEESVRDVLKIMLRHLGYEADASSNGREAIAMFREKNRSNQPYDLVISDLTMPGEIGGVEILEKLRELDPRIKVIVSSGYSNNPVLAEPRSIGFSDRIRKPYSIKELGDILFRVLIEA